MKKRFLITLISCLAGLTLTAGGNTTSSSSAATEKAIFDSTARYLDLGGNYYSYICTAGILDKLQELCITMIQNLAEEDSADIAAITKLTDSLLNLGAIQALGGSSITASDAPGVYVIKSFVKLSQENPQGVLFDFAGRQNRTLAGMKMIPANTRLAFGLYFDPVTTWGNLSKTLASSTNENIKNFPTTITTQAEAVLGCKFNDFLSSITGEIFFLLTSDGSFPNIQPKLLLIVPDSKGLLGKLILSHANDLNLKKESDQLYTLQDESMPPFLKPQLILEEGRIVIASSNDIYNLAKAADNRAAAAPELAPYFKNIPNDGLNFFYVNAPKSLIQSAILLGAQFNPVFASLQPMLAEIPGVTLYNVLRKEKDGYASSGRSNLSVAQLQIASPFIIMANGLMSSALLSESKDKPEVTTDKQ